MSNPPQKIPHEDAPALEHSDRPAQWVLDLGLEVASGRRPWLRTLAAVPLMLATTLLIPMLEDENAATAERSPELAAVVENLTRVVTVLSWVLAGVFLVGGIGYWFVCRHAHAVWRSLPVEEREELTRQRVEGLRQAIIALGGVDPEGLPLRAEDLYEVSDRHRRILEDLQAKAKETSAPICAGARARTEDLVMAARLHRALSRDTIVRPPHAV